MNVLLLGSGGRENAIAWSIKKNSKLKKLYIAPGNYGTSLLGTNIKIDISANLREGESNMTFIFEIYSLLIN